MITNFGRWGFLRVNIIKKPKSKAKHTPGVRYPDSTRREARKIYLSEGASDREIAERVGVNRPNTVREWRIKEDWEKDRQLAAEKAAEKIIEKIADTEAQLNARHYNRLGDMEAAFDAYLLSLVNEETGEIVPPNAKDFNFMAQAHKAIQGGQRLAMGLPDKVTEERRPKDEAPDYPKMPEAEVMRLAGYGEDNEHGEPTVAEIGAPTNGSGRLTH